MKFAVSNIALPAFDHTSDLNRVADLGFEAIEVAPSRVWRDTWHGLTTVEVSNYRRRIERAGLGVVGLHSLFYDQPALGLFKDPAARAETLDFLEHLSKVCRDLGGRTLIYGGGRQRGDLHREDARDEAVRFLRELSVRIEPHGTCICFEPLGPDDTDFINSALECLAIAEEIGSPAVRVQLDAKALIENNEANFETFRAVETMLVHFHANEPGLVVLGSSGRVDHRALGNNLHKIGYAGYISIEQRMMSQDTSIKDIARSAAVLRNCYTGEG